MSMKSAYTCFHVHMLSDSSIIEHSEMQNHTYGISPGCKNRQAKHV